MTELLFWLQLHLYIFTASFMYCLFICMIKIMYCTYAACMTKYSKKKHGLTHIIERNEHLKHECTHTAKITTLAEIIYAVKCYATALQGSIST